MRGLSDKRRHKLFLHENIMVIKGLTPVVTPKCRHSLPALLFKQVDRLYSML